MGVFFQPQKCEGLHRGRVRLVEPAGPQKVVTNGKASKSRGSIAPRENFWQEIVLEAKCRFVRRTFDDDDDDDDDDDADDVPGGTLKFSRIRTVDVDRQVDVLGIIEQEQSGLLKNLKI